jgi:predicted dehydrogenase
MLRVAIVGCGKIADAHVAQIRRVPGAQIVGVCDREPLMALQFHERFSTGDYFSDLQDLLRTVKPDVAHITTPPDTHFALAKLCLEHGCHVYVEKPFTLFEHEARELIADAQQRNLKVTAGHDDQFGHAARRMRALIRGGFLGGPPVHMESYYCYELSRSGYSGALLSDQRHWVRRLPGKLLHNIISHGIARISEHIAGDSLCIHSHGFVSNFLKGMGEVALVDELRVVIAEEAGATAYFTFSSQMRPSLHQFRIYGPGNGLVLDHDQDTVMALHGRRYKSYLEKFIPPLDLAGQSVKGAITNAKLFLNRDFHMKSGMKFLIESFYDSIVHGTSVPIPYREILLTAKIMDAVFGQLNSQLGYPATNAGA